MDKLSGHGGGIKSAQGLFSEACIPDLLTGETVFSWCARFHRLNCGWDSNETSQILFEHRAAGLKHDIPVQVGVLHKKTSGQLGDEQRLLIGHTLFGFHAPFLSAEDVHDAIQSLSSDGTGVRDKLGIKRAGISRVNPLKSCPQCVDEQVASAGFAYWKIEQQLPTAYVCKKHGVWFQTAEVPERRGSLQAFHLPDEPLELTNLLLPYTTEIEEAQMRRLGSWGDYIFGNRHIRLTGTTLRHCYLHQAKARGWLTFDGKLRLQHLRDAFVERHQVIFRHFDRELLGDLMGVNGGFLASLLRQLPSRRHPLKYLLLINFLFENGAELEEVAEMVQAIYMDGGERAVEKSFCGARERLYHAVAAEGQSMNQAAAAAGISASSAAKFLNRRGLEKRERRPRIVGTNKEPQLQALLSSGEDRQKIAQTLGLKTSFIKDYLAARSELKAGWEKNQYALQLKRHREKFLAVLEENPGVPIKAIRQIPGNGFQWLYNHDREWLQRMLPGIWKVQPY